MVFFPIVVLIYFIIPQKIKSSWLLMASYYFYMCWNAKYVILLFTSTIITYWGGIILEKIKLSEMIKERKVFLKKFTFIVALTVNLIILFYFKYINFVMELGQTIAEKINIELSVPTFDILLPVGISFYIFQALGYLIDVYRGEIYAERNLLQYALFVSFFPQLVAGPIERSKNLLRQLAFPKKFDSGNARDGLLTMLWGYFLKLVIADRCSVLVNTVYASYEQYIGFQLILANMMFALQIYCDFMGYSIIAKGAARVLGIHLMDNFDQPYFAMSIKDFWRRWHISLSSWFRDYVYIPLGGSRCSKIKKYRNLFLTFLVSGLWHGASLTFVVWGMIHGLYQIAEDMMKPLTDRLMEKIDVSTFSWRVLKVFKTFVLVDIAWIFFRADTIGSAVYILKKSFDLSNIGLILNDGIYQLGLDTRNMNFLVIGMGILFIVGFLKERGINVNLWLSKQNVVFRYGLYWGALILIIFSLDITGQEFIYFQF